MQLRLQHVLVLSGFLGLSACLTPIPEHIALAPAHQEVIASTEVLVPITQNEIYVFVPASNVGAATGGGLLGALIDAGVDSSRMKKSELAVKPLRDAVVDVDMDGMLRDDLKKSLSQIDWLHVSGARVIKEVEVASIDKAITDSKDTVVLVVSADYHLSADAATLDIVLNANMFSNNPALTSAKPVKKPRSAVANAIYRNSVTYRVTAPDASGDRDKNIANWSANNGEPLRAAMREGSAKVSGQMASDLQGQITAWRGALPGGVARALLRH